MKKLRKKIFWSIELSALSILFLILLIFNLVRYFQYEQKEWQMLSSVMESAEENLLFQQTFDSDHDILKHPDDAFINKSFHNSEKGGKRKRNKDTTEIINNLVSGDISLIQISSDGTISSFSGFIEECSEEERSELVNMILKKDESEGRYLGMKFLYKNYDSVSLVAVLDSGYINMDVVTLALVSLFGLFAAGTLFALIARKISIKIAEPVEETIRIQKQFIADASHELKTPVSVILANISVLEKEFGKNRFMNYLKEEGKRMADLINSLLVLSRLDYEQEEVSKEMNFVSFNLSDALFEIALPFESIAFETGLTYLVQIPEDIMAYGVPEDIRQAAGILLDNALKYTNEHGTVIINVEEKNRRIKPANSKTYLRAFQLFTHRNSSRNTGQIIIQIKNTGTPIPPDVLPQIFNRFYKADSSRKYNENSFGLGLSIAKSLVEKNHGTITVESNAEFTVFSICIPV